MKLWSACGLNLWLSDSAFFLPIFSAYDSPNWTGLAGFSALCDATDGMTGKRDGSGHFAKLATMNGCKPIQMSWLFLTLWINFLPSSIELFVPIFQLPGLALMATLLVNCMRNCFRLN